MSKLGDFLKSSKSPSQSYPSIVQDPPAGIEQEQSKPVAKLSNEQPTYAEEPNLEVSAANDGDQETTADSVVSDRLLVELLIERLLMRSLRLLMRLLKGEVAEVVLKVKGKERSDLYVKFVEEATPEILILEDMSGLSARQDRKTY